jgi:two-component system sensor histidine kinase DegS
MNSCVTALSGSVKQEIELIRCELHDGACQYLTAAVALLETFRSRNDNVLDISGDFDAAVTFLRQTSAELRRLVGGVLPPRLDDGGVLKSIESMLAQYQCDKGPDIEFSYDGKFDAIPQSWHVAILRIVQECLNNALRHSRTHLILVGLIQDQDRISIQVQDWGIGFDPDKVGNQCYGLRGVLYRAESLGGTVTIDASVGNGTCILVELPLPESETSLPAMP